tara:strand:+ start:2925 stop:3086 length:162 start_codon:yes stop_codon:yes gene_type:complete
MEIREPERLTPVVAEADVVVVGSGPGGYLRQLPQPELVSVLYLLSGLGALGAT